MKVAVTGSTGFVGRHVVAELARRGCDVTCVLRRTPNPSPTRVATKAVRVDLAEPSEHVFEAIGSPEVLIHLAWGGLPNYDSLHHFEAELPLHYAWLKSLVAGGLVHVVSTGTCFEYGLQCGALREDMATLPVNAYGLAKDRLRRKLEFLQAQTPMMLTWARLFYMFGDGQSEQSLLPQLRRAVARGDAKFAMSGGEQLRDYLPVGDAARHLVDLALAGRGHGVVNVCAGRPISVRALVEAWIEANGWTIGLDLGRFAYPTHEPMAFWGDDAKLRGCLSPR